MDFMLNGTLFDNINITFDFACKHHDNNLPFMFSKSRWLSHVGAGLAYVLILQNIIIIRIFLKTNLLSPVSILLSVLAFSDTLSVFFWFFPEHIGALFQWYDGKAFGNYTMVSASFEHYPFCIFGYWSRYILSAGFHSSAILITTALGLQKVAVMMFPIFSKSNLSVKCAILVSVVILSVCFSLELPYAFFFSFSPGPNGRCCKKSTSDIKAVRRFLDFSHYLRSGILIASIIIQILTMIYIASRLTFCRKTLWTDSKTVRKRNRRSTVIIIYITVIFIVSELPSVIASLTLDLRYDLIVKSLQYLPLIISLGCFFNFWLYLVMSQKFRKELNPVRKASWQLRSFSRRPRRSAIIV